MHIGTNAIEGILLGIILIAGFTVSQIVQHRRKSRRQP